MILLLTVPRSKFVLDLGGSNRDRISHSIKLSVNSACVYLNTDMNWLQQRGLEEWQDLDVKYPLWLYTLLDDELYYALCVIAVSVNSFAVGVIIGWISGHTGR